MVIYAALMMPNGTGMSSVLMRKTEVTLIHIFIDLSSKNGAQFIFTFLVWLKNISKIQHSLVRADVPYEDVDVAFLVQKLQPSNRDSLPLNNNPSFKSTNGVTTFSLFHPREAFTTNLRAYIYTLIPTLQCRMDFQTTNGRSMLLKYTLLRMFRSGKTLTTMMPCILHIQRHTKRHTGI